MTTAWSEVLTDSCLWADGKTGKPDCLKFCTTGLFNEGKFVYSSSATYHIQANYNEPKFGYYNLSGIGAESSADCRDVSTYLHLAASSLGHPGGLTDAFVPVEPYWTRPFRTNPVRAIGTPDSYAPTNWNFHQVFTDSGLAYDACAAQERDLAGNIFRAAPAGWVLSDFWQTQVGGSFYGLTNGYSNTGPTLVDDRLFEPARVWGPRSINQPLNIFILQGVF
jgi:hypothetical protein